MNQRDQAQLRELLGKLLLYSHKGNHTGTFKLAWKLLYALGAHVSVEGDDIFIVNPKGP